MKVVFADTFYFLALLNRRDPFHERAVFASRTPDCSPTALHLSPGC